VALPACQASARRFLQLASVSGFFPLPFSSAHSRSPVATILKPARRARATPQRVGDDVLAIAPCSIIEITPASWPCARRSRFSTAAMLLRPHHHGPFARDILSYPQGIPKPVSNQTVIGRCGRTSAVRRESYDEPGDDSEALPRPCVRSSGVRRPSWPAASNWACQPKHVLADHVAEHFKRAAVDSDQRAKR